MTTFEQYLENLMGMKKAEIINEGITWGIWANTEGNKAELMKWKKCCWRGVSPIGWKDWKSGATKTRAKALVFFI